jgi:hypothetical protein
MKKNEFSSLKFTSINDILSVEECIKNFFIGKCIDYDVACETLKESYTKMREEYNCYELGVDEKHNNIPVVKVFFEAISNCDDYSYVYILPLDILFDHYFTIKMQKRIIEYRKQEENERAINDADYIERQKIINMDLLHSILKKYPYDSNKLISEWKNNNE